ncbi:MAG: DUF6077 domain-containing protein [Eubacteriales bacterium]|nr:DUF6077 domain-containing protein [Eubacteriales bacterium]
MDRIKFIVYFCACPILWGWFLGELQKYFSEKQESVRKAQKKAAFTERSERLRHAVLYGYLSLGICYAAVYYLELHTGRLQAAGIGNIWKWISISGIVLSCAGLTVLSVCVKNLLSAEKRKKNEAAADSEKLYAAALKNEERQKANQRNREQKLADLLIAVYTATMLAGFGLFNSCRYQNEAQVYLTADGWEFRPIHRLYYTIGQLTGDTEARVLLVWVSLVIFVIALSLYGELAEYLFPEERKKQNAFMTILYLTFLTAVFTDSLDTFGLFICPWRSETLLACVWIPALFLGTLKWTDAVRDFAIQVRAHGIDKNLIQKTVNACILLITCSMLILLYSPIAVVLGAVSWVIGAAAGGIVSKE